MSKLYLIKIRNFCSLKDTVKKTKRQATDWENIFTIHIPDKGLVPRLYKKTSKSIRQIRETELSYFDGGNVNGIVSSENSWAVS